MLPVPIAAFGGTDDSTAPPSSVEKWRELTSRTFHLRVMRGSHFFLHEDRPAMLTELATAVRTCAPWLYG